MAIALIAFISSCKSGTDIKQILSKSDTRKAIMDTIANNNEMSQAMMEAMINSENGKMMMMGNEKMRMMMMEDRGTMMKMMKDNPGMMQNMMSDIMETCKSDTAMMSTMCKNMMGNQLMMDMMEKMKKGNKDMNKMGSMHNMKGMDNKTKK
jgi:hypothetical protein